MILVRKSDLYKERKSIEGIRESKIFYFLILTDLKENYSK